eukprot:617225-Hanusia_phi.AAC.3
MEGDVNSGCGTNACDNFVSSSILSNGEGCVYSYDAIGCLERLKYTVSGSGHALIEPFLDNLVAYKNTDNKPTIERSCEETLELVKDIFSSAGERDIYTGDFVDIYIIDKNGTRYEQFPLKKD